MNKDFTAIFNEFLLSMVNQHNANLIQDLRVRWKEYLNTLVLDAGEGFVWDDEKVKDCIVAYQNEIKGSIVRISWFIQQFKKSKSVSQNDGEDDLKAYKETILPPIPFGDTN